MAADATNANQRNTSVLFVCLGNICRSPMAHGVLQHTVSSSSNSNISHIDSCGTGAYHIGSNPDPRTMSTLSSHGITSYRHSARKIKPSDFKDFDLILGMDAENLEDLQEMRKKIARSAGSENGLAKVQLFGAYGGRSKNEVVVDPYYGADDGFEVAYEQMTRFSSGLLAELERSAGNEGGK